jgi:hypothetical protein
MWGIVDRPTRSVRQAICSARRLRLSARVPMFIHDPAKPAVLDPTGRAGAAWLDALDQSLKKETTT